MARDIFAMKDQPHWKLSPPASFATFIRHLPDLLPAGSVLYLEGTNTPEDLEKILNSNRVVNPRHFPSKGTILPRPDIFQIPVSVENNVELARILQSKYPGQICTHVHAYCDDEFLVEWYDASANDCIRISKTIDRNMVDSFCRKIGVEYRDQST